MSETSMDSNRRRQGGRGRRLDGAACRSCPGQEVRNPYLPMEVLSADQLEAIHLTSLRILEDLGMEVMSPRALAVLRRGAPRSTRRRERSAWIAGLSRRH